MPLTTPAAVGKQQNASRNSTGQYKRPNICTRRVKLLSTSPRSTLRLKPSQHKFLDAFKSRWQVYSLYSWRTWWLRNTKVNCIYRTASSVGWVHDISLTRRLQILCTLDEIQLCQQFHSGQDDILADWWSSWLSNWFGMCDLLLWDKLKSNYPRY